MPPYTMKVCISILVRLHEEATDPDITHTEYARRALAIQRILDNVEEKFGIDAMVYLVVKTSKLIGKTLAPLDISIIHKLTSKGCKINHIHKVVQYNTYK